MKILIDTNVIIDILEKRELFFDDSYMTVQLGLEGKIETFMSASAITDVYYILYRSLHNKEKAKEKIFALTNLVNICNTTNDDITNALVLFINDFEDAVTASIAKREKANYIITRNERDFINSPVPAINPSHFLQIFEAAD
ncbi:MAG: PIN domain-containing protein [Treponema sp.]|jgi:predicted nucleic acid-binding protein|nr:PIN domain-containing protein [Treponema sp.]